MSRHNQIKNRLNHLLELFQQYKELSIDYLLEYLAVPRTTLAKDIERLQNLGYEIEYFREKRAYVLLS
jgi:predicted DNA-binding transcriptional regulator YafY